MAKIFLNKPAIVLNGIWKDKKGIVVAVDYDSEEVSLRMDDLSLFTTAIYNIKYIDGDDASLSELKTKINCGNWISIKDQHPNSDIVVVYDANSYYSPAIARWECGHGFVCINGEPRTCWNVTHWMPLPPKPIF